MGGLGIELYSLLFATFEPMSLKALEKCNKEDEKHQ